jgi:hypothetical protein
VSDGNALRLVSAAGRVSTSADFGTDGARSAQFAVRAALDGEGVALGQVALVPVGVGGLLGAGFV